jgi:aldose sugar dehydrogenase
MVVGLLSCRAAIIATLLVAAPNAAAQEFTTRHGRVRVVTLARGLEHPWGLAFLPDGRFLVTERPGRLRIVERDGRLSQPVAGVPEVWARGQGGLLDVALAPDFDRTRLVYLSYAEPGRGGAGTTVARARLADGRLDELQVIFRQEPKRTAGVHFGSRLVFTRDGHLFITTGDRGQRDDAQDLSRPMGKVIRIRLDGSVPSDNPFAGRRDARAEVWSFGHRNMQGAALHPVTGQLWTVEHGARGGDEVNVPKAGRNYGWPVITYGRDYSGATIGEGTEKAGLEQPVHYWDPSISPSGLAFYAGDRFPAWRGSLFVGSLSYGLLIRLEVEGERVRAEERMLEGLNDRVRDVRQGPDGYLYLLTDESDGRILRIEPAR